MSNVGNQDELITDRSYDVDVLLADCIELDSSNDIFIFPVEDEIVTNFVDGLNITLDSEAALRARLAGAVDEFKAGVRIGFYTTLVRRVPRLLRYLPSYVTACQKHYGLPSRNAARRMLAMVEGYSSWASMMKAAASQPER